MAEQLTEIASRHQAYLERYKSHIYNQYNPFLIKMAKLVRAKLAGDNLTEFGRDRLEKLLKGINKDLRILQGQYIEEEFIPSSLDLAQYEAGFEARSLEQVVKYDFVIPSDTQLKSIIMTNPMAAEGYNGVLLKPFLDDMSTRAINNVTNKIREGAYEGLTTPQIIKNVIGTKAKKYSDGKLKDLKLSTERMVKTGLQHVSNQARMSTWERNKDIVEGWRYVVTFDSRTSTICRSVGQERKAYPLGEGKPPPLHILCRSTTEAVLNKKFDFLDKGATRFSRDEDGVKWIDADAGYYDWLKTQSAEFQDSVIGKTRGRLLREGGLTADRFAELQLNKKFEPMTLEEMAKVEPLAFEKIEETT